MSRRGLTLVEVLVALVVASVSIAALALSARTSLVAARRTAAADTAARLASTAIEELLARPFGDLAPLDESSVVTAPAGRFSRRIRIETTSRADLWRFDVVVRHEDGPEVRLETLRRVEWRRLQ